MAARLSFVRDAVKGKIPMGVKNANLPIIDVRDVAAVCAGAVEGGNSSRYLVPGETTLMTEAFEMLSSITGNTMKIRNAPAFMFTAMGAMADGMSKITKKKMPVTGESIRMLISGAEHVDATYGWDEAKNDFGVPGFDTETTLRDTVTWLHSAGHLSDKEAGTAAS